MICTYPHLMEKEQKVEPSRFIYILLLRYPDNFSKIFRFFSRCYYNHVSIGISDTGGTFYSYVTKGFRIELPKQHPTFKRQEVPCRLYRVEISDEVYAVTKEVLANHQKQAHNFKYNNLGLLLCFARIVYPRKQRYFCSQFVCEILEQIRAVPLAKHSALYLPDDFMKMDGLDLCFSGLLSQLVNVSKSLPLSHIGGLI